MMVAEDVVEAQIEAEVEEVVEAPLHTQMVRASKKMHPPLHPVLNLDGIPLLLKRLRAGVLTNQLLVLRKAGELLILLKRVVDPLQLELPPRL